MGLCRDENPQTPTPSSPLPSGNDGLDVNALNNLGYFVGPCGTKSPNVLCVGGMDAPPNQASRVRASRGYTGAIEHAI